MEDYVERGRWVAEFVDWTAPGDFFEGHVHAGDAVEVRRLEMLCDLRKEITGLSHLHQFRKLGQGTQSWLCLQCVDVTA